MVDIVNRSRVLCLFKILYHKYIFLDVKSIFLVQVLLFEDLYLYLEEDDEKEEKEEKDELPNDY